MKTNTTKKTEDYKCNFCGKPAPNWPGGCFPMCDECLNPTQTSDWRDVKERFTNQFVDVIYHTQDHSKAWFDKDGFIKTPDEVWKWFQQELSDQEQRHQREMEIKRLGAKLELCDILLSQGHGGGNWRRLIYEHRQTYLDQISQSINKLTK